ncbi:hypothetical protein GCK32_019627 [Trichostrongylus colubriformis]|uniref:Uncharacterized protein n=1 Tax=Trichostrongylus colubriformis TaxID=6319 RepID=A0AAN8FXI6_TRICO
MSFGQPRMPSQVCVNMDAPSVRTRLITPPFNETTDFSFIYISNFVTITVILASAFLVWRWGLHGFGTHLSVALALILLIFNAYLGARAWADLHYQNEMYLKYQLRNVSQMRPAITANEKYRRNTPSPVWIERNNYANELEHDGVVK